MNIRIMLLGGACALACTLSAAHGAAEDTSPPEPRGALTLGAALELARAHHPDLVPAEWRVRAARARRGDAGRLANPTAAVEVENFGGSLDDDRREITVTAGQLVELGGKRGARVATADALGSLAAAERAAEERRVLAATSERFLEAWTLQERIARLAFAEDVARRAIAVAEQRHRAGAAPAVEGVRAQAFHALRRTERRRVVVEHAAALRRLVAQWGSTVVALDSLVLEEPTPLDVPPADSLAARLAGHPERLRAAAEVAVEEARAVAARALAAPDLSLSAGARRLEEVDGTGLVAGVSLPLPLWTRHRGEAEAAAAEREAARARARTVEIRLDEELRAAHDLYRAALEAHTTLRAEVRPMHEEALRQIAAGYREGRFGSLELLDAQRALLEAELALIDATAEAWRARHGLERLLGVPLESLRGEGR